MSTAIHTRPHHSSHPQKVCFGRLVNDPIELLQIKKMVKDSFGDEAAQKVCSENTAVGEFDVSNLLKRLSMLPQVLMDLGKILLNADSLKTFSFFSLNQFKNTPNAQAYYEDTIASISSKLSQNFGLPNIQYQYKKMGENQFLTYFNIQPAAKTEEQTFEEEYQQLVKEQLLKLETPPSELAPKPVTTTQTPIPPKNEESDEEWLKRLE